MSLKASAHRLDGLRHEIVIDGRHILVTDEPRVLGGSDLGPTPQELIPASLAACVATTIQMYAARKDWDVGDVSVDVEYDHESAPQRFHVTVRLPVQLSDQQKERITHIAGACPVHRSLEAGFAFEHRLVDGPSGKKWAA
jgi:putative redox protein